MTELGTYTKGFAIKTNKIVTKNNIITLCKLLNCRPEYANLCEFQPEAISEGGILFKFKQNLDNKWYKSVRLCVHNLTNTGNWGYVNENSLYERVGNFYVIFDKNIKTTLFLKSFNGAPLFTLEELKIWEECFNLIGIVKIGKYPILKKCLAASIY